MVEVYDDPDILIQPLSFQEICVGGVVDEFEVLVEMEPWLGEVSYQWYDQNGFILNAIDSTYTPPVFTSVGTFEFYVEVNWSGEGCDGLTSEIAEVEVVPDPIVSIGPSDASYCQGAASDEFERIGGRRTWNSVLPVVCECDRFESRRNFIARRNELGVLTPDRCDWYVLLLLRGRSIGFGVSGHFGCTRH